MEVGMIKFENVSCGYGEHTLFSDLNFVANTGEITAISAPSGRGKTTLLKAINRLHEIDEDSFWHKGKIIAMLDGSECDLYETFVDVHLLRRKIAYVFQSPTALPMSIEANVAFGLKLADVRER